MRLSALQRCFLLALTECILNFARFNNNVFHNSFKCFGYAICKTDGSIVFGLRSVFNLFRYHFNLVFFQDIWNILNFSGARYEETDKGFNFLRQFLKEFVANLVQPRACFFYFFKLSSNFFVLTTKGSCSKCSFAFIFALVSLSTLSQISETVDDSLFVIF